MSRKPAPLTWADASVVQTAGGWHFVLPIPERVNAVWRQYKGRTIVSAKHRADKVTAPAIFRHVVPLAGDVACRLLWVRARKAGDVDGRIKTALDLLRGIAYADDAQVADMQIVRVDDPSEAPRLEVIVTACATPSMRGWGVAA